MKLRRAAKGRHALPLKYTGLNEGGASTMEREVSTEALSELWREGVDSGEGQPLDAKDIKSRGRERLAARKASCS